MDEKNLNKVVKSVNFGKVRDRFNNKTAVCQLALTNGYVKNFKLLEDDAEYVRLLSEGGANPIKEYSVKKELSKEGNEYTGLFITLSTDVAMQFLIESKTLRIMELIYDRTFLQNLTLQNNK